MVISIREICPVSAKHISSRLARQITVINLRLRKRKKKKKRILAVDPFPTSRGVPVSRAQIQA